MYSSHKTDIFGKAHTRQSPAQRAKKQRSTVPIDAETGPGEQKVLVGQAGEHSSSLMKAMQGVEYVMNTGLRLLERAPKIEWAFLSPKRVLHNGFS